MLNRSGFLIAQQIWTMKYQTYSKWMEDVRCMQGHVEGRLGLQCTQHDDLPQTERVYIVVWVGYSIVFSNHREIVIQKALSQKAGMSLLFVFACICVWVCEFMSAYDCGEFTSSFCKVKYSFKCNGNFVAHTHLYLISNLIPWFLLFYYTDSCLFCSTALVLELRIIHLKTRWVPLEQKSTKDSFFKNTMYWLKGMSKQRQDTNINKIAWKSQHGIVKRASVFY